MSVYTYKIIHEEQEATLVFQTLRHGEVSVSFRCIPIPNGGTGLVYDCFNLAAGKEMQQVSDENEFAEDLATIMYLLENPTGATSDIFIDTFDAFINQHIQKYGRIVDVDLSSAISQITISVDALAKTEPKRGSVNENGKRRLLEMFLERAEQKFGDFLYLTRHVRTPYGLQPQLISFNEFKKNL